VTFLWVARVGKGTMIESGTDEMMVGKTVGTIGPICQTNGSSAVTVVVVLTADHGDLASRRNCCCVRIPWCGTERLRRSYYYFRYCYYSAAAAAWWWLDLSTCAHGRYVMVLEYGKQRVAIRGRCWYHGNYTMKYSPVLSSTYQTHRYNPIHRLTAP